ncbi:hypothetical protein Tco_0686838 [Tanacetum coccineum]
MANPDDEPMWAADRLVAPNPGLTITIPATANEFAIKATKNEAVQVKENEHDNDPQEFKVKNKAQIKITKLDELKAIQTIHDITSKSINLNVILQSS